MEHIPEQQIDSIVKLFVTWNNHANEQVGRRMVHRFDKWFECLATIHLGENKVKSQVHLSVRGFWFEYQNPYKNRKSSCRVHTRLFQTRLDAFKNRTKHSNSILLRRNGSAGLVFSIPNTQNLLLQVYANGNSISQRRFPLT